MTPSAIPATLWPNPSSIPNLTPHQREQAARATALPFGILAGIPGTGKTFTAAALVRATTEQIGRSFGGDGVQSLAVAAPTGKAAVRCSDAMQAYGLEINATTIHRLLGITRNGHDGNGWGFYFNRSNPLPYRVIIIDEVSMLDTDLAASFFDAVAPGTHVLFVGDPYQLPPVGHGAPLRDMLSARYPDGRTVVPSGELSEIKRNDGAIVRACRAIRNGERVIPPAPHQFNVASGMNWKHHEVNRPALQLSALQTLIECSPATINPIWDIQVLCAVNETGELSRKRLNEELQRILNPHGQRVDGCPFRVGDKVICTSNSWHILHQDEHGRYSWEWSAVSDGGGSGAGGGRRTANGNVCEVDDVDDDGNGQRKDFVANGEIGRVEDLTAAEMFVRFYGPKRVIRVPIRKAKAKDAGDGDQKKEESRNGDKGNDGGSGSSGIAGDFELAYAITTHKAQGSQAPIVISLVDESHGAGMVTSREWWYTAASRAEKLWMTIGRIETLNRQCRKVALSGRKTFLAERLRGDAHKEAGVG